MAANTTAAPSRLSPRRGISSFLLARFSALLAAALVTCALCSLLVPFFLPMPDEAAHRRAPADDAAEVPSLARLSPGGGSRSEHAAAPESAESAKRHAAAPVSSRNNVRRGSPGTVGGDENTDGGGDDDDGRVRVFIAVKTTAIGVYQERIAQVRRTWLRDAVAEPNVDLRFFVGNTAGGADGGIGGGSLNMTSSAKSGAVAGVDVEPLVVALPECADDEKLCKTFGALRHFLDRRSSSSSKWPSFFCNFDDDSYVLIPALLRALSEYTHKPPNFGKELYLGQQTLRGGVKGGVVQQFRVGKDRVHFHTGGAYCLSSDLVRRGVPHLDGILHDRRISMDDVAVGYLVGNILNVTAVVDKRFKTHLDPDQRKVPLHKIRDQVSFGYQTKWKGKESFDTQFASVPRMFGKEEDPLLFRSLRCFLLGEATRGTEEEEEENRRAREEYEAECPENVSGIH